MRVAVCRLSGEWLLPPGEVPATWTVGELRGLAPAEFAGVELICRDQILKDEECLGALALDGDSELVLQALRPLVSCDLLSELRANEPRRRAQAALRLAEVGPGAKASHAALVAPLLADPVRSVKRAAVEALGLLGASAAAHAADLGAVLGCRDRELRRAAAVALGQMGEAAAVVAPRLAEGLRDWDRSMRSDVACALGSMGVAVASEVLRYLSDPDQAVRSAAAAAIGRMGAEAARLVVEVLQQADDDDDETISACAAALGLMGEGVEAALEPLAASPESRLRRAAAEAPGHAAPAAAILSRPDRNGGPRPEPALEALLLDGDCRVCQAAAASAAKLGAAEEHAPVLARVLGSEDRRLCAVAARALGQIGRRAAAVAGPSLVELMQRACGRGDEELVRVAISALGQLGPGASEHARELAAAARACGAPGVLKAAASALRQLGPDAHGLAEEFLSGLPPAAPRGNRTLREDGLERFGRRRKFDNCV